MVTDVLCTLLTSYTNRKCIVIHFLVTMAMDKLHFHSQDHGDGQQKNEGKDQAFDSLVPASIFMCFGSTMST